MAASYKEIADILRAEIANRTWPPGSRLPSERDLGARFNAAPGTIRSALTVLRDEGLTEAKRGSGVYVQAKFQPIVRNAVSRLSQQQWGQHKSIWAADVGPRHMDVDRVKVFQAEAPEHVARALGTSDVWIRDRRYLVEGRPVMLARSYLPAEIVAGSPITEVDSGEGGTYARLLELGFKPERFREELRGRLPTAAEAEALGMRLGQPVEEIVRTTFTATDQLVEVNEMVADARAYVFQYDFTS